MLAHVGSHRVIGIALPPIDATFFTLFIVALAVCERTRKGFHLSDAPILRPPVPGVFPSRAGQAAAPASIS